MKLKQYNKHNNYLNKIDNIFKWPICDSFFHKADHFNRHLFCCRDQVKTFIHVYTLGEKLSEKLVGFNFEYTKEQLHRKCCHFLFWISLRTLLCIETEKKIGLGMMKPFRYQLHTIRSITHIQNPRQTSTIPQYKRYCCKVEMLDNKNKAEMR